MMNPKKRKTMWRWWAKALGEKPSKCDRESDNIAIIRTVIFATYLITNCFIVAGVIRHWNKKTVIVIQHHEVPGHVSQTKEERILTTNRDFAYD
jgi:hypothetical protein